MSEPVRVGIVDSGCHPSQMARVRVARSFVGDGGGGVPPDSAGHGTQILDIIARQAPQAELMVAQVFGDRLTTTADHVAAAIGWLVDQGADVINLSLGLREDRPVLRAACQQAVARGVILCAATPAQGGPVYPSAYHGVLRMTGDARCQPGQYSWLGTENADFGGCVRSGVAAIAGASVGCAHMTGHVARLHARTGGRQELWRRLETGADFIGREYRATDNPSRVEP